MTASNNSGNSAISITVPDDEFHAAMRAASVSALWERPDRTNTPVEIAHVWRWETMEPLLDAAVGETSMEDAERRVLTLTNPAMEACGRFGASKSMSVNLQILMPGERARPHRHTMAALRFVIDGTGAVTVVLWNQLDPFGWGLYELLPAFVISLVFIAVFNLIGNRPSERMREDFDAVRATEGVRS